MPEIPVSGAKVFTSFYLFVILMTIFPINRNIFPRESGDRADESLTPILSYRHGNAHYAVRTVSRPFQLYQGDLHTCKAGVYIGTTPSLRCQCGLPLQSWSSCETFLTS